LEPSLVGGKWHSNKLEMEPHFLTFADSSRDSPLEHFAEGSVLRIFSATDVLQYRRLDHWDVSDLNLVKFLLEHLSILLTRLSKLYRFWRRWWRSRSRDAEPKVEHFAQYFVTETASFPRSQVHFFLTAQIRKKMVEIITRETQSCDLKELVQKFIPELIGKEIEKATAGIYPLQNTFVRKVKILKSPKFDLGKLMEVSQPCLSCWRTSHSCLMRENLLLSGLSLRASTWQGGSESLFWQKAVLFWGVWILLLFSMAIIRRCGQDWTLCPTT
jgi:hypothetical protein